MQHFQRRSIALNDLVPDQNQMCIGRLFEQNAKPLKARLMGFFGGMSFGHISGYAEDAVDFVVDEVKDTITGVPKTVMEIGENVKDVYDNVKDGEFLDAGRELVDVVVGVTDLAPGSGTVKRKVKKIKKAIEAVDLVGDLAEAFV